MVTQPNTPADVSHALSLHGYIPDDGLATSVFLAMTLRRPLLLEGEAGVGKTEVAKVLSRWTGGELIRLQCYEGIDVSQAVYDWDYSRQLLHLRAAEATGESLGLTTNALEQQLYNERFLLKRALLQAIDHAGEIPPVLLIDEIDRADDEFEPTSWRCSPSTRSPCPRSDASTRCVRRWSSSPPTAHATCTTP